MSLHTQLIQGVVYNCKWQEYDKNTLFILSDVISAVDDRIGLILSYEVDHSDGLKRYPQFHC